MRRRVVWNVSDCDPRVYDVQSEQKTREGEVVIYVQREEYALSSNTSHKKKKPDISAMWTVDCWEEPGHTIII